MSNQYSIKFKYYLQLVRFPGIFTAFSNILLGFFVVQNNNFEWMSLYPLLITSGSLFLAGMALNDYFDFEIDKKERPNRPLPSGKIKKSYAFYIGICFLIIANISAIIVGIQTLVISLIMTGLILAYDKKIKSYNVFGILNLSSIRFLNVILGTTVISLNLENILYALPIAFFVAGISVLAKKETLPSSKTTEIVTIILVLMAVAYLLGFTANEDPIHYVFVAILIVGIFLPYAFFKGASSINTQKKITFLLLGIILLDASLISAFSDVIFAIITLILYVPSYLIIRKMYLT